MKDALRVWPSAGGCEAHVPAGYDVFGVTHGGFLAALALESALLQLGLPDVFSCTTHFMKKARVGPIHFEVQTCGASRRFTSVRVIGRQEGESVLTGTALLGERKPPPHAEWSQVQAPAWVEAQRTPPLGPTVAQGLLPLPGIAQRTGMRLDMTTVPFARGEISDEAKIVAVADCEPVGVATAVLACDLTPPPVWNVLGMDGWVPTLELTAHVRAVPQRGPLTIEARTRHVSGGFLEEDACVWDATGSLVVQSRQLARAPAP